MFNIDKFYKDFKVQKYWGMPSSYSKERRQNTASEMIYSGNYIASEKKDGFFERIIKHKDEVYMVSREPGVNGWVVKTGHVPHLHDFFYSLPNDSCILGEIYLPGKTSRSITTILGCDEEKAIGRQAKDKDKLRYYIFDILAWDGTDVSTKPLIERIAGKEWKELQSLNTNSFVSFATYWQDPTRIYEEWLNILAAGGEGVVLARKDYQYNFGKNPARATLKLKKELQETVDVFLTGRYKEPTRVYTGKEIDTWTYWYDEIERVNKFGTIDTFPNISSLTPITRLYYLGYAGSLEIAVMKDGKITPVGWLSGVDDSIKKGIVENPKEYRHKVCELQAMEIDRVSSDVPTLRHARVVRWRDDKDYTQCSWSQLK